MKISLFTSFHSNDPTHMEGPWDLLQSILGTEHKPVELPEEYTEAQHKAAKLNTPSFCPSEFKEGTARAKKNVREVHLAVLDLDDCSQIGLDVALEKLMEKDLRFAVYTSFSHRKPVNPASPVKARIVIDLDRPIPGPEWLDFWLRLVRWFEDLTEIKVDRMCKDSGRLYGLPYSPFPEEGSIYCRNSDEGKSLKVAGILLVPPLEEGGRSTLAGTYAEEDAPEADTALEMHKRRTRAQRYLKRLPAAVEGKGGDTQTLKAAYTGAAFGLTVDQFWPLMLQYNHRCDPPWDPGELRLKVENAYRYNERPFGYLLVKGIEASMTPSTKDEPDPSADVKDTSPQPSPRAASPQGLAQGEGTNDSLDPFEDEEEEGEEGPLVLPSNNEEDIAQHYLERHGAHEEGLVSVGSELYIYDKTKGTWSHRSQKKLKGEVKKYHNALIYTEEGDHGILKMTKTKMTSIADLVIHDLDIINDEFLIRPPAGIAFKNGFVFAGPDGVDMRENNPRNRATWGVDLDFDPELALGEGVENWLSLLDDLFAPDEDRTQKILMLQQWIGATLLGIAPQYARALVLLGPRGSAKSTTIEVIEGLLPAAVRGTEKPQDWGKDTQRASLSGVRLNAVNELPERDILANDYFKQIITGEETVARHIYGHPFRFTPQAGHVFSCNSLPGTIDNTSGFWGRMMVLKFNRSFTSEGGGGSGHTKRDYVSRALKDAPGIFAWALMGADDLIRKGRYDLPPSHHEELASWRQGSDSVTDFVNSCCDLGANEDGSVTSTDLAVLHRAFTRWAQSTGRKPLGIRSLASRLRLTEGVKEVTRGKKGVAFLARLRKSSQWLDFADPTINY